MAVIRSELNAGASQIARRAGVAASAIGEATTATKSSRVSALCNLSSTDVPLMPGCSTSILLHSAGGALVRPIARTRYTFITYHTTLYHIPHDEYTAAGRPRAGGRRRGTRGPVIGGGALVTTEKQKIKPKTNKLSKRDAPRTPPYFSSGRLAVLGLSLIHI